MRGVDIKDNSLGGAQIKESTLGQVPNAKTIGGRTFSELQSTNLVFHQETDACTQPGIFTQCAAFSVLKVPAGHQYIVTVTSSITAFPGGTGQDIAFCPATDGATCISGNPEVVTLPANQFTNATAAATDFLDAGIYTISTSVKVQNALFVTATRIPQRPSVTKTSNSSSRTSPREDRPQLIRSKWSSGVAGAEPVGLDVG